MAVPPHGYLPNNKTVPHGAETALMFATIVALLLLSLMGLGFLKGGGRVPACSPPTTASC